MPRPRRREEPEPHVVSIDRIAFRPLSQGPDCRINRLAMVTHAASGRATFLHRPLATRSGGIGRKTQSDIDPVSGRLRRNERAASHSITSSARARSVGGMSRASAFALLRLITNSYLVGSWIGRSVGFSPSQSDQPWFQLGEPF